MSELPTSNEAFATFELEPLDTRGRRSWEAEQIWETARHKLNRIALGVPRWSAGAVNDEWLVGLDLTLLPDEGCRFRSAELSIQFSGLPSPSGGLPVVRSLVPQEVHKEELAISEKSGTLTASLTLPLPAAPGLEASRGTNKRVEVTRTLLEVGSFGLGTSKAGWRFYVTNATSIPFSTTGLEARITSDAGFQGEISYSVVAQIDVLTSLDRWLTAAFVDKAAGLHCAQPFPSRSD